MPDYRLNHWEVIAMIDSIVAIVGTLTRYTFHHSLYKVKDS